MAEHDRNQDTSAPNLDPWGYFARRWQIWVAAACIHLALFAGIALISVWLLSTSGLHETTAGLLSLSAMVALLGPLAGNMCRMAVRQVHGEDIHVSDALRFDGDFLILMGASLALLAAFFPASLFPSLAVGLVFTFPLIVDRKLSVSEAMSESWRVMAPKVLSCGAILGMYLFFYLGYVVLCSVIVFAFPVAMPMFWLAVAVAYRSLCPSTQEVAPRSDAGLSE